MMAGRIIILAAFLYAGAVSLFGQSIQVDPSELNGSGNSANDSKLVSVPPVPPQDEQQFEQSVKDVHFDYDKSDLRAEDRAILTGDAEWLKAHPDVVVTLEGDADERGTVVYNLVLSGERANTVKDALVEMGVPAERIAFATGWGKLYPVCSQSDESCWSQNRRTHFATWPPAEDQGTSVAIAVQP